MLVLILDAAAIMLIIALVNKGQELSWGPAIISALIIGVGTAICSAVLGPSLGVFAVLPMLVVAIPVIWMVSGIPLGMASIAGVIFIVCKIAITLGLSAMMSTS
jgi:hypothetical protein